MAYLPWAGLQHLLVAGPLIFSACSSIQLNAKRSTEGMPQANDTVTGGSRLAVSAFRSTLLGVVRQPVTTVRTGLSVFWHRPKEMLSGNLPVRLDFSPRPAASPGTAAFESLLDQQGLPRRESGRLTWLIDGPEFFAELDHQIASAEHSVDLQFFIYDNDDVAVEYSDRLKAKADHASVRILFDDLGSTFAHAAAPETPAGRGFVPPADIAAYLKSGSQIHLRRTLNPWLVCDHTKLLVFDRRTAMLGGMNMGREYFSEWHDLMVKIEGPIVASLQREFSRAWRKAGPLGDLAMLGRPRIFQKPAPVDGGIPLRVLRTDPAAGQEHILNATLLALRASTNRIWIQNPYFAYDAIALELEAAARRGVDVRVILPARGDSTVMDAGNLGTARGLVEAGARVYRYPKMTHMKVMICDGWAQVGSANLDILSVRINRELNLAFSDPAAVNELSQRVFLPDFRASQPIRPEALRSPVAPIAETIADQL